MLFHIYVSLLMILACCDCSNVTDECPNVKAGLSNIRKRRHLVFPEGTNFVLTISLVKAFMTHAPAGWNTVMEIDVLYPMPDANYTLAYYRRKLHHRQKRDLWERLQAAFEFHNFDGHSCILKSICEAKTSLAPPGKSVVHDILRAIFTAPNLKEDFIDEMKGSFNELTDPDFCEKVNECPFSLLSFLFMYNNKP